MLWWEITEPSHNSKHHSAVPQNCKRIPPPKELVDRLESFNQKYARYASTEMSNQFAIARHHAELGCVSDVSGVKYI